MKTRHLNQAPAGPALPNRDDRSILFLIDQLTELGGAERIMFALARSLSNQGYRVSIVTLRSGPSDEVYKLADEVIVIPITSCFSTGALRAMRVLNDLIRERKITLVQTWFESADLFGAVACRIAGVKAICSSRRDMGILRSKKHDLLYKVITPLYGHVFAVSHKVARWHQQKDGISQKRISVVHNGVVLDKYSKAFDRREVRLSHGISENELLVTTIANINPWKGVDVFIETAAVVLKQVPNAVFVVAGDWTDKAHLADLRARAVSLGISKSIRFLGRIEDIPSLLRSSDVFALLSRSEGFPNVVIEAMAAALPVVATDVGGTAEAIIAGVTGFLVKNEDHQSAASHLLSLLTDAEKRDRFGLAGKLLVEDRFSIRTMVERHVEVYDAILTA